MPWQVDQADALASGEKPSKTLASKISNLVLQNARSYGDNDFKLSLTQNLIAAVIRDSKGV
jgi:xanthine dehydrogenase YagS FAD-binding subunit